MTAVYRVFYRLGMTPWEQPEPPEPVVELAGSLPPGRVLDIGCGTGRDTIHCARQGWQATGIDDVPLALKRARARAAEAGVPVRFERADITRPLPAAVGTGYDLLIDMGCLHNLAPAARPAAGRALTAVAKPGATLVMMAFATGGPKPGPEGMDASDVKAMFPDWDVISSRPAIDIALEGRMATAEPHYHRLVRRVS